jgi:hypothetical protein
MTITLVSMKQDWNVVFGDGTPTAAAEAGEIGAPAAGRGSR